MHPADTRSIPELLTDLGSNIGKLVRNERELFQAEMSEKAREFGKAGAEFGAAAIMLYAAFLLFLAAVVLALSEVMHPAWAALLVAVVVGGIGAMLLGTARKTTQATSLRPDRTAEQLRKDKQLVKEQAQ